MHYVLLLILLYTNLKNKLVKSMEADKNQTIYT